MRRFILGCCLALGAAARAGLPPANAGDCPGNPDALGTSRVLTITPGEFTRLGSIQYPDTLPLNDHEVVITFDDGPIPPYSTEVLDALASQCVKATYFLVGEMAHAHPELVRRIYNAGHTIGTHSQDHPYAFRRLSAERVEQEVDDGIASVDAALGDARGVAPFFRIPGLSASKQAEAFLASKSLVTWSADVVADDWFRHVTAKDIVRKAMRRLDRRGRGILLLHDIHPATAAAVPMLLKELKAGGYHVVQVVAAGERPASVPDIVVAHASDASTASHAAAHPTKSMAARRAFHRQRHAHQHEPVRHRKKRVAALHNAHKRGLFGFFELAGAADQNKDKQ
jgi:peptidoglycan/xylan/chitin deacetylase (PgdA/CDA1 family)